MDLRPALMEFVNSRVSLDPSQPIVGDTDLLMTGLVDSIGVFEIVGWIQTTASVEIDPVDIVIENFRTVDRMVALVDRLRSQPTG